MERLTSRRLIAAAIITVATFALAGIPNETYEPDNGVLRDKHVSPGTVRASKLFDITLRDPAGKDVGHITDVILDPDRRDVAYIALAQGVAIGRKVFAVPYAAMQYGNPNDAEAHLKIPAETLAKATPIDESMYPTHASSDLDQWLAHNAQGAQAQLASAQMKPEEAITAGGPPALPADAMWAQRCSMLVGSEVIAPNGNKLGVVRDVVMDKSTGRIAYAAVQKDQVGIKGDYYAVPLDLLRPQAQTHKLVLPMSPRELANMPNFDPDHWPSIADPTWSALRERDQSLTQ